MLDTLQAFMPHIAGLLVIFTMVLASGHAVLFKRDVRAVVAWVGLIWLVPVIGAVLYLILGINRIKRRAKLLRKDRLRAAVPDADYAFRPNGDRMVSLSHFSDFMKLVDRVVQRPLLDGNRVVPLVNGDSAYPLMVGAIEKAERSVALSTYIFDNDAAGKEFVRALDAAVRRGVDVRVLIDDVGCRYSWPPVDHVLHRAGIRTARFLPTFIPWRLPFMNLRNHRKILVVDGTTGFTGGMNIRRGHVMSRKPRHPIQDLHFLVEGPVVSQLQEAFIEDWAFSTREILQGEKWFAPQEPKGPVVARGIPEGPDEDFEKLLWTIQGALACARSSVRIVTPYFLPDSVLIRSLNLAALRGIEVDIVLPSMNNIPLIKWASTAMLWQLLERGCRIWLSPPPFDHSKLMIVDCEWSLFGSANWDPRSLRLNFEFNVECYDRELAGKLEEIIGKKIAAARRVTLDEVDGRPLPLKLRDGVSRLFSPYL